MLSLFSKKQDLPKSVAELFYNKEKTVCKVVHKSGAETTIKTNQSCDGTTDPKKVVVFISSSVGCNQGCKFCYLTAKKYPYCKLSETIIIKNTLDAITACQDLIKGKYLKLSFMGMGDVFYENLNIKTIVRNIFKVLLIDKEIEGIDGVDIGTCMPNTSFLENKIVEISKLNKYLFENYFLYFNPKNVYTDIVMNKFGNVFPRTPVRLFVSLSTVDPGVRHYLMPNSIDIIDLENILDEVDTNIIFHCMFFEGLNDSFFYLRDLKEFVKKHYGSELRILRFNKCSNDVTLNESPNFWRIIDYFKNDKDIRFKYQISTGKEIQASCGQFICKNCKDILIREDV
jgi:adenine C2-methylase RlmN of 23S rRNA A2503 and tRNA A37